MKLLFTHVRIFYQGCPPTGARLFIPELSELDTSSIKNWDFTVLALGNSAYANSFINFAQEASDYLRKVGLRPVLPIHVADELKNQDDAFCEWEENFVGILYSKDTPHGGDITNMRIESGQGGEKRKMTYTGTVPLTKDEETIVREIDRMVQEHYKDSYCSHMGTLLHSTDLFSFKAEPGSDAHEYLNSGAVQPGDHIGKISQSMGAQCSLVSYSDLFCAI